MSTGYFEEKVNALYEKLTSTYVEKDFTKRFRNWSKKVNLKNLPSLFLELIDLSELLLDEVSNLQLNLSSYNQNYQVFNDTTNPEDSSVNHDIPATNIKEEYATLRCKTNDATKENSILLTLPQRMFNSLFCFLNTRHLTEIFETENKSIQKLLTNYLKAYIDMTSPVLECYLSDDKDSFHNLLVNTRINFSKQPITHLIVKNCAIFHNKSLLNYSYELYFMKYFDHIAQRSNHLKVLELEYFRSYEHSLIKMIKVISKQCDQLEEVVFRKYLAGNI